MSAPKRRADEGGARVWVASAERAQLGEIIRRMGGAPGALEQGRVFVDGRRTRDPALLLEAGQRVELHSQRRPGGEVALLDQRDGLVFALKPPELPTEPDHHGLDSLRQRVAEMMGVPTGQLHAVSRLDVGVSGVVLLAMSSRARRHVESVRSRGALRRRYVGIAEHAPAPVQGSWDAPIGAPPRGRGRVARQGRDRKPAETRYAVLGASAKGLRSVGHGARELSPTLVAFEPRTGRTHQIRIHASDAGAALLGDRLYGGALAIALADGRVIEVPRIALHAAWVELPDLKGSTWRVQAPDPRDLVELWSDLGGRTGAWDAIADELAAPRAALE